MWRFVLFAFVILILILVLVPLSFSYVEYYEYGLVQRRSTGSVDVTKVYPQGRYALGPDNTFLKYQADAHIETLDSLSVFSAGVSNESIGLEFLLDVNFAYFLVGDEIGSLHRELATTYPSVILSRTKDAIKNEAAFVTFQEYFRERKAVESRLRSAVQVRWDTKPALHATLDQFHLARIKIPDNVAKKQLEAKIQAERNDQEAFIQQERVEREITSVEVNKVSLETEKTLRTARAEANLLVAKAKVEANRIRVDAQTNGTLGLISAVQITNQSHISAFAYIRMLADREQLDIDVNYLTPDNVVKTRQV